MKKWGKILVSTLVVIAIILVGILGYVFIPSYLPKDASSELLSDGYSEKAGTTDRIIFLNTGSSDCIIIESNGLYAMIDSGEDTEYPADKPALNLTGYEGYVLNYLLENCADENGKVTLEFIVGTYAHSDHIGGFDTIISNENITVKKAYLKEYNQNYIKKSEVKDWDNEEVYTQMRNALIDKGVNILQTAEPVPFVLGDFNITIFNGEADELSKRKGENENSFGVLVEKNGIRAFLAGDINNLDGDEERLADQIGDVDLLKVGHHGYVFSSTNNFIKTLSPEVAIITNYQEKPWNFVIRTFSNNNSFMLSTVQNEGITAYFTDNGLKINKDIVMNKK